MGCVHEKHNKSNYFGLIQIFHTTYSLLHYSLTHIYIHHLSPKTYVYTLRSGENIYIYIYIYFKFISDMYIEYLSLFKNDFLPTHLQNQDIENIFKSI